jgi:hypothetical protein
MVSETSDSVRSEAFIRHLARYPEDLCDIRRLQRLFRLSAPDVSRALNQWLDGRDAADATPVAH